MNIGVDDLGIIINFDMVGTVAIGLISLVIGKKLKVKLSFLDRFGIPAAVIGGLFFAIIHLLMRESHAGSIAYDTALLTPFMVVFFTTIGLGSSINALKRGGKLLIVFWLLSGVMTLMQTIIGVALAKISNIHPLFGVLAGSVSMSGGHGSAGAFGKTVEEFGVTGGLTVALSAATFGLIAGGLLGAPLAIPLLIILGAQVVFMYLYTRFIVFKAMGSDYDAAVMVSGMCGSGLGATTNAMINMGEVSNKYGYTVNPYLIVPLTGAFLIDIFQMPVIITAINMFK